MASVHPQPAGSAHGGTAPAIAIATTSGAAATTPCNNVRHCTAAASIPPPSPCPALRRGAVGGWAPPRWWSWCMHCGGSGGGPCPALPPSLLLQPLPLSLASPQPAAAPPPPRRQPGSKAVPECLVDGPAGGLIDLGCAALGQVQRREGRGRDADLGRRHALAMRGGGRGGWGGGGGLAVGAVASGCRHMPARRASQCRKARACVRQARQQAAGTKEAHLPARPRRAAPPAGWPARCRRLRWGGVRHGAGRGGAVVCVADPSYPLPPPPTHTRTQHTTQTHTQRWWCGVRGPGCCCRSPSPAAAPC